MSLPLFNNDAGRRPPWGTFWSLLFRVVLQQPVIGIVFQLHGENQKSVALYNATKQKKLRKSKCGNEFSRSSRSFEGILVDVGSSTMIWRDCCTTCTPRLAPSRPLLGSVSDAKQVMKWWVWATKLGEGDLFRLREFESGFLPKAIGIKSERGCADKLRCLYLLICSPT